jgi:hypothetical protein
MGEGKNKEERASGLEMLMRQVKLVSIRRDGRHATRSLSLECSSRMDEVYEKECDDQGR